MDEIPLTGQANKDELNVARKVESVFRQNTVTPFLKTLKRTHPFPIQQLAIRGTLDFLLCCSGTFVALELKADDGVLDPLQIYNLDEVKRTGGVTIVASPRNWAAARAQLVKLDQGEYYD